MDWHMFIVYSTFILLAMYYTLLIVTRITDLENKIIEAVERIKEVAKRLKGDEK